MRIDESFDFKSKILIRSVALKSRKETVIEEYMDNANSHKTEEINAIITERDLGSVFD